MTTHPLGVRLFSFAVIADTHLEPEGARQDLPRSNARASEIMRALNRNQPSFVLHLGDLIHPPPYDDDYDAALAVARRLFASLKVPIHFTPGNHDIGDKPLASMPTPTVRGVWMGKWNAVFGGDDAVFDHEGCRFVLVNSPSLNAHPERDATRLEWMRSTFAEAGGKRTFVATHYPLFLRHVDEPDHYDNVGEPSRGRLLTLFAEHDVEAVFSGHIHNLMYHRLGATDFYGVPATSFVRRDFSEIFRVAPFAEYGREDPDKLGFFWIDVHDRGHVARCIRLDDVPAFEEEGLLIGHPKDARWTGLGVDLRHPWCETVALPASPPVSPFSRRKVRNDYQVQALLDLGLRDLRMPIEDVLSGDSSDRAKLLAELGFRVVAYAVCPLSAPVQSTLQDIAWIDALELVCLPSDVDEALDAVGPAADRYGFALWLNELQPPRAAGGRVVHRVSYGLDPKQVVPQARMDRLKRERGRRGIVFRTPIASFTSETAARIHATSGSDIETAVLLDWSADNPSDARNDDHAFASAVADLLRVAKDHPEQRLILDTFMDFDRGYHARTGLIDRRAAPRSAGRLLRLTHAFKRTRESG